MEGKFVSGGSRGGQGGPVRGKPLLAPPVIQHPRLESGFENHVQEAPIGTFLSILQPPPPSISKRLSTLQHPPSNYQ